MASTKKYLDFILGQLSDLDEVSFRTMMGEYGEKEKSYIYTSVSTAAQTEGYSLEAQQERLRERADYKNLKSPVNIVTQGRA